MALADPTIPGLNPPNPAVIARLLLTLLVLPVAGLARTWDLRSYTGTMLAVVTGRERAYSQRYTERFLARLAHAGAAERLTAVVPSGPGSCGRRSNPLLISPLLLPSSTWTVIARRSTVTCSSREDRWASSAERS